jgi:hypothetical protein
LLVGFPQQYIFYPSRGVFIFHIFLAIGPPFPLPFPYPPPPPLPFPLPSPPILFSAALHATQSDREGQREDHPNFSRGEIYKERMDKYIQRALEMASLSPISLKGSSTESL